VFTDVFPYQFEFYCQQIIKVIQFTNDAGAMLNNSGSGKKMLSQYLGLINVLLLQFCDMLLHKLTFDIYYDIVYFFIIS
jgi:hypothetical protein